MSEFRNLALCTVSLMSLASPAWAQAVSAESTEETAVDSGEIVVQARRREENLQDVPVVINAVSSAAIEKLNLRNFTEIASVVPGLSLSPNANGIGSSSSMRGVNQDVNVSGENGTIQYYVNDVPVASALVLQAMYDIGQVSVERGPQGTLRGRSTPSGSININWRQPDLNDVGAYVSGSYGSREVHNAQFGIGVPVIPDVLAFRVAGLTDKNRGNNVRSVNSSIRPEAETESIRASVRFEPFEFFKAGAVYQALNSDSVQFDQVQSMNLVAPGFTMPGIERNIAPPLPAGTFAGGPTPSAAGNYGTITLSDRKSVAFTPRSVKQRLRYYGWNAELDLVGQRLVYVGSKQTYNYNPVTNNDIGAIFPALNLLQDTHTDSVYKTHEIRLQNVERVAGMFDYVVGYFNQKSNPGTRLTTQSTLSGYFPVTNAVDPRVPVGITSLAPVTGIFGNATAIYLPKDQSSEVSWFGNVIAHFGDATEMSGGLRHVNFKKAAQGLFISCTEAAFAAGTCTVTPGTANSFDVSKTIYNLSVRHRFSDDLMVYAATGSSFRPPVVAIGNFSIAYSPLETAHTSLGAETSKSYEIGIKSSWMDRKIRFNATYYHQDFNNYPFRAGGAGVYYINVNSSGAPNRSQFNFITAVPVKVDGVEAELAFRPSQRFNISTTLNWSKSSLGKSRIACTDALNNGSGAVGSDGIPDTVVPTLGQMQAAYGSEHLAECAGKGSATFLPEWSGSVQAEYNLPVTNWADAYVRGLLAYRGSTENDPQNPYDNVGAYGILNLYAGVRDSEGAWEIGLYAKNVANVTRLVSGNDNVYTASTTLLDVSNFSVFGSDLYSSNYRGVSVTPPREIGVSLRFALGSR